MAERKRKDDEPSSPASSAGANLATFGGVGAAVALARKGIDGPLKAIRKGEEMRRAGAKPSEIHAETSKMLAGTPYAGVTYGADMKPRFEIDDSAAKMKFAAIPAGREAFIERQRRGHGQGHARAPRHDQRLRAYVGRQGA